MRKDQESRTVLSVPFLCYDLESVAYYQCIADDLFKIQTKAKDVREFKILLKNNISDESFVT